MQSQTAESCATLFLLLLLPFQDAGKEKAFLPGKEKAFLPVNSPNSDDQPSGRTMAPSTSFTFSWGGDTVPA